MLARERDEILRDRERLCHRAANDRVAAEPVEHRQQARAVAEALAQSMRVGVDAPRLTRGVSLGRTQRDSKQCQQADLLLVALCALRQLVQQREAASRQHCCFARRRSLGVVARGKLVVLDRLSAHAGALEVGRDLARVLRDPVPVADDQPTRDRRVPPASLPRALPVVGRLGEELMTEAKRGRHGAVGPREFATDEREAVLA